MTTEPHDRDIWRAVRFAAQRRPLLHVTTSPWLARLLVAAGASRAESDVMTSRGGDAEPPVYKSTDPGPKQQSSAGTSDFDEFFGREFRDVVRCVMFAGATWREAESATTTAMVEADLSWPLLENPTAWVRKVALADFAGKIERDQRRSGPHDSATGRTETDGELSRVAVAVRRLSPSQRETGALFLSGYRAVDIAENLGRPADTVRANLRYAVRHLRHDLETDLP